MPSCSVKAGRADRLLLRALIESIVLAEWRKSPSLFTHPLGALRGVHDHEEDIDPVGFGHGDLG